MVLVPVLGNILIGMFDSLLNYGKSDRLFLMIAPYRVRDDKEVMLAAVKNSGLALEYASDALKNDEDILAYLSNECA